MSRKLKSIIFPIISLAFATVGYFLGFFHCAYSQYREKAVEGKLKDELSERTESYYPSCAELQNTSIPKLVQKGNDYYFVHTSDDYFYVFGISVTPSNPPQMSWWGAGRKELMEQACDKK